MRVSAPVIATLFAVLAVAVTSAQPPSTVAPVRFEVASVKPNTSGVNRVGIQHQPGGRWTAANVTLRDLIREAHHLLEFQLIGGPDWIDKDRFDIVAKADGNLDDPFLADPRSGPTRLQLMVRALLADRFSLATHEATRELPVYALTRARGDGRLGAGLRPATTPCSSEGPERAASTTISCGLNVGPGRLTARDVPFSRVANVLSMLVQRTIVDRTTLSGQFDVTVTWTPDALGQGSKSVDAPAGDGTGTSLFTAIQEQLGLKVESTRGPVPVAVIDRAHHPAPD